MHGPGRGAASGLAGAAGGRLGTGTTRATYRYTWNFLPDGREGHVFWYSKVHARHGYRWTHPVHEVLTPDQGLVERVVTVQGMQLDHHADESKSRAQYLPLLELSVQEDPEDDRNMHYLGREYMFRGQWEKAIATLKRHLSLPRATWRDERCASMRFLARCCQAMGQEGEAEELAVAGGGGGPLPAGALGGAGGPALPEKGHGGHGLLRRARPGHH